MVTVLAVADTDSYLKWSVATLARLPDVTGVQVVLANPVQPSPAQRRAAGAPDAPVLSRRALSRLVNRLRPDAVLLAGTGPVVSALLDERWARRGDRPVLLTGLPGISVPATARALQARMGSDLFVLHSHREVTEFADLAADSGIPMAFGLARLPFLPDPADGDRPTPPVHGPVLFAAQAKVPAERAQREAVLVALARTGNAVVKLRAAGKEQQTHHEALPYPDLHADLLREGRLLPGTVQFASGPMQEALAEARALVTVSSTAALEAMAAGLPVLLVDDFGVSETMINTVFAGSGCLGSLADLEQGRFCHPDPAWREANYFHPAAHDSWREQLDTLLQARAAGRLPAPVRRPGSLPARWRRRLRLSPLAPVLRLGRRRRRPSPGAAAEPGGS